MIEEMKEHSYHVLRSMALVLLPIHAGLLILVLWAVLSGSMSNLLLTLILFTIFSFFVWIDWCMGVQCATQEETRRTAWYSALLGPLASGLAWWDYRNELSLVLPVAGIVMYLAWAAYLFDRSRRMS
jgi:hypothetical protein